MTVHLSKLAVGCDSIDMLLARQTPWLHRRTDGKTVYRHRTRFSPKRIDALLAGGSMYWIIAHQLVVRQAIVAFEPVETSEAPHVLIHLDPAPVRVRPQPRRAHQGWRYLEASDAPPDIDGTAQDPLSDLPAALVAELRTLALI